VCDAVDLDVERGVERADEDPVASPRTGHPSFEVVEPVDVHIRDVGSVANRVGPRAGVVDADLVARTAVAELDLVTDVLGLFGSSGRCGEVEALLREETIGLVGLDGGREQSDRVRRRVSSASSTLDSQVSSTVPARSSGCASSANSNARLVAHPPSTTDVRSNARRRRAMAMGRSGPHAVITAMSGSSCSTTSPTRRLASMRTPVPTGNENSEMRLVAALVDDRSARMRASTATPSSTGGGPVERLASLDAQPKPDEAHTRALLGGCVIGRRDRVDPVEDE
jgi:hypothetical protein